MYRPPFHKRGRFYRLMEGAAAKACIGDVRLVSAVLSLRMVPENVRRSADYVAGYLHRTINALAMHELGVQLLKTPEDPRHPVESTVAETIINDSLIEFVKNPRPLPVPSRSYPLNNPDCPCVEHVTCRLLATVADTAQSSSIVDLMMGTTPPTVDDERLLLARAFVDIYRNLSQHNPLHECGGAIDEAAVLRTMAAILKVCVKSDKFLDSFCLYLQPPSPTTLHPRDRTLFEVAEFDDAIREKHEHYQHELQNYLAAYLSRHVLDNAGDDDTTLHGLGQIPQDGKYIIDMDVFRRLSETDRERVHKLPIEVWFWKNEPVTLETEGAFELVERFTTQHEIVVSIPNIFYLCERWFLFVLRFLRKRVKHSFHLVEYCEDLTYALGGNKTFVTAFRQYISDTRETHPLLYGLSTLSIYHRRVC